MDTRVIHIEPFTPEKKEPAAGAHGLDMAALLKAEEALQAALTQQAEGTDPAGRARLLVNLVQTASEQGASLLNYARVTRLRKDGDGFVAADYPYEYPDSFEPGEGYAKHAIDGDRLFLVGLRGDVLCIDRNGQADGNDGPFQHEGTFMAGEGNPPFELGPTDGDVIWRYDPIDEIGVIPHDAASCAPIVCGDVVYTGTSNGVDEPHTSVLACQDHEF